MGPGQTVLMSHLPLIYINVQVSFGAQIFFSRA
jgi:hypothetical protein